MITQLIVRTEMVLKTKFPIKIIPKLINRDCCSCVNPKKNQLTKGGDLLTHLDLPSEQCMVQLFLTLPNQERKFLGIREIKMEFLYDLDQEDRGFF